jgi:hypothetical protein
LEEPQNIGCRKAHIISFVFGFSQFTQYAVFAALYYFGALFITKAENPENPDLVNNVFTAIFAMMFGAMGAAQGSQFGPDMGKGKAAANKIFAMIDYPTKVDAVKAQETKEPVRIDDKTCKGEI